MKIREANCEHFPNKENSEGAIRDPKIQKKTDWADKLKKSKKSKNFKIGPGPNGPFGPKLPGSDFILNFLPQ